MARGRKPKNKVEVSQTVQDTIKEVLNKQESGVEEIQELVVEEPKSTTIEWDVKKDDPILFFDSTLSYEITKYRPINETEGLDFNPEWFQQAKRAKLESGKYCMAPRGTKKYRDFWTEEFRRCNEGMECNGYRITGDNYFFLNYYQLKESKVEKAGQGRGMIFPEFFSKQYEYFHYVELCELTKHDVCAVKARAVGFSEIAASLGAGPYSTRKNTHMVYVGFVDKYVDDVLAKTWYQLDNLNANSEGGMKHVRQKHNSERWKKASKINRQREELPDSWNSEIIGQVIDNPRKLRGDRIDRLFFEESGSNPCLVKTYLQGNALVEVLGEKVGTRFVWGTGGDQGGMDGLSKIFYNPEGFNVLPYKHNCTKSGDWAYTGFFIPSYTFVAKDGYIDKRGVTNTQKAKEFYENRRKKLLQDPKAHLIECAEFCFTPDEAFALEGDNQFNTVLLTEQLAAIQVHKLGPKILTGDLDYVYKDNVHREEAIEKVKFVNNPKGHVHILEAPYEMKNGIVPRNLYVAGIDGIDMGKEDTSDATTDPSDFCVVIMKRMNGLEPPKPVAYYRDRPLKIREAHMTCLKLLQWYNCQACLESTRISVQQFFREKKCENKYLMRRPRSCQPDIQGGKSKQFGAPATESVIQHQLDLISDYIDEYCSEIWFEEFLIEAMKYSYENKRKFDIIAAWGMAMLANEELMYVVPKLDEDVSNKFEPFGYYKDERGITRYGKIPKKEDIVPNFNLWPTQYYNDGNRTSDSRYVMQNISARVHW